LRQGLERQGLVVSRGCVWTAAVANRGIQLGTRADFWGQQSSGASCARSNGCAQPSSGPKPLHFRPCQHGCGVTVCCQRLPVRPQTVVIGALQLGGHPSGARGTGVCFLGCWLSYEWQNGGGQPPFCPACARINSWQPGITPSRARALHFVIVCENAYEDRKVLHTGTSICATLLELSDTTIYES